MECHPCKASYRHLQSSNSIHAYTTPFVCEMRYLSRPYQIYFPVSSRSSRNADDVAFGDSRVLFSLAHGNMSAESLLYHEITPMQRKARLSSFSHSYHTT